VKQRRAKNKDVKKRRCEQTKSEQNMKKRDVKKQRSEQTDVKKTNV
jgi:hypothetical protein